MNSLVGYGVSSDSDSDGEGDEGSSESERGTTGSHTEVKKSRNFLLETGSASSDSESEHEDDQVKTAPPCPAPVQTPRESRSPAPPSSHSHKLPPPPLGGSVAGSSVFANPFKERAEERLHVLQKHVPLTLQARPSQIGGRKMCVSYRKDGRCRFGSRCKYAHDSDLASTVIPDNTGAADDGPGPERIGGKKICLLFRKDGRCRFGARCKFAHDGGPQSTVSSGNAVAPDDGPGPGLDQANPNRAGSHYAPSCLTLSSWDQGGGGEEEGSEGGQGRKRRVGLSNTLTPPKRAMKQYALQRERETVPPS